MAGTHHKGRSLTGAAVRNRPGRGEGTFPFLTSGYKVSCTPAEPESCFKLNRGGITVLVGSSAVRGPAANSFWQAAARASPGGVGSLDLGYVARPAHRRRHRFTPIDYPGYHAQVAEFRSGRNLASDETLGRLAVLLERRTSTQLTPEARAALLREIAGVRGQSRLYDDKSRFQSGFQTPRARAWHCPHLPTRDAA